MSQLDDLLGGLLGGKSGGIGGMLGGLTGGNAGGGGLAGALVPMIGGLLAGGGLNKLLSGFHANGQGSQADSWVSTGQNMPVSGDQVTNALGHGNVQTMAQKLGLPPGATAAALAALLPVIIDQLTPKGHVEQQGDLSSTLAALKSKFLT